MTYSKLILMTLLVAVLSCEKSTERKYYPHGAIESEVPLKDGKVRHGLFKEYYQNGKVRVECYMVNGIAEGKYTGYYESGLINTVALYKNGIAIDSTVDFYESGQIAMITYYNMNGKPLDFKKFNPDGTRNEFRDYIMYRRKAPDTLTISEIDTLFIKIGNIPKDLFGQGTLIITSSFDSANNPVDTLSLIESNNKEGFVYEFSPAAVGKNSICGKLLYYKPELKIPIDSGTFIFEYYAKE